MSLQGNRPQGGPIEEPSNFVNLDGIITPPSQDVVLTTNILEVLSSTNDPCDEWLKTRVDMDVMTNYPSDTLTPVDILYCVPDFSLKNPIEQDPFGEDPLNLGSKDSLYPLGVKESLINLGGDNYTEFPEEFGLLTDSPAITIPESGAILQPVPETVDPPPPPPPPPPCTKPGPSKPKTLAIKPAPNPRSILKRTQAQLPNPETINTLAIIAISTDKSKNMTEIVINTSSGEQIFKGCTTDLMKASTLCPEKLEKILTRTGQSIILKPEEIQELTNSLPITPNPVQLLKPLIESDILNTAEIEEQPTVDALADLGIQIDKVPTLINDQGNKLWICPISGCTNVMQRQTLLKVHILKHFGVRPYKCSEEGCDWAFYTFYKLKRHKDTHLKRKDFECTVANCGKRFTTIYNLHSHEKLHSRPAELACPAPDCTELFQTRRRLELHLKVHDSSIAPYRCTFEGCGKHYYSANSLNSHSRSHMHTDSDLRCSWPDCNKIFGKPCRLKAHMRVHTGEKPYACRFPGCTWAFPSASKLRRHQHKHTNERRFRCPEPSCKKAFMRSEHLREHTLTHQAPGERNYVCRKPGCGVRFSAKSSLYVHIKRHKADEEKAKNLQEPIPVLSLDPVDDPSCTAARTRCTNIKLMDMTNSEEEDDENNTEDLEEEMVHLPNLLLHEELQLMPILDSTGSQATTINLQDLQ